MSRRSCVVAPTGGSAYGQSTNGKPNGKQVLRPKNKIFKQPDILQLAVLLDEFAQAITEKRAFKTPGEMGLRDLRVLEAIYASAKQNGARAAIAA
jgi:predicted dehydrogenase